jgi:hypothetical protein
MTVMTANVFVTDVSTEIHIHEYPTENLFFWMRLRPVCLVMNAAAINGSTN